MRERLIELLQGADKKCNDTKQCENCVGVGKGIECVNHLIADYLLANGVIVPPCKVGYTVYYLTSIDTDTELNVSEIFCGVVVAICYDTSVSVYVHYDNGLSYYHRASDFGNTVFLTKEEAEQALDKLKGK